MSTKTWARIDDDIVVELVTLPDSLVPGETIFTSDLSFVDVTGQGVALGWILANGNFAPPPLVAPPPSDLLVYAAAKELSVNSTGRMINVDPSAPTPKLVFASTDDRGLVLLNGAYNAANSNPNGPSIDWTANGTTTTLTPPEVVALGLGVYAALQANFTVLATLTQAINASPPTVTTYAAIDAAAWATA